MSTAADTVVSLLGGPLQGGGVTGELDDVLAEPADGPVERLRHLADLVAADDTGGTGEIAVGEALGEGRRRPGRRGGPGWPPGSR